MGDSSFLLNAPGASGASASGASAAGASCSPRLLPVPLAGAADPAPASPNTRLLASGPPRLFASPHGTASPETMSPSAASPSCVPPAAAPPPAAPCVPSPPSSDASPCSTPPCTGAMEAEERPERPEEHLVMLSDTDACDPSWNTLRPNGFLAATESSIFHSTDPARDAALPLPWLCGELADGRLSIPTHPSSSSSLRFTLLLATTLFERDLQLRPGAEKKTVSFRRSDASDRSC
ncbi:hypothetical protein T484DRAFT_1981527 [Baffinella frigidus]|nr:hypothetical protein T484DRAFT_1981527 [Cryptophyta sp. CCMP2293]